MRTDAKISSSYFRNFLVSDFDSLLNAAAAKTLGINRRYDPKRVTNWMRKKAPRIGLFGYYEAQCDARS